MWYDELQMTGKDFAFTGEPKTIEQTIGRLMRAPEIYAYCPPELKNGTKFASDLAEYAYRNNLIGNPGMIAANYTIDKAKCGGSGIPRHVTPSRQLGALSARGKPRMHECFQSSENAYLEQPRSQIDNRASCSAANKVVGVLIRWLELAFFALMAGGGFWYVIGRILGFDLRALFSWPRLLF